MRNTMMRFRIVVLPIVRKKTSNLIAAFMVVPVFGWRARVSIHEFDL